MAPSSRSFDVESQARAALVAAMQRMDAKRLNAGASGNASVRWQDGMLITPTGIAAERVQPEQIVFVDRHGHWLGPWRPSSEWQLHLAIYAARPEVAAIAHCHPLAATAVACHRRELPPFHYMIAEFGGSTVRCARYARFGTAELAQAVVEALKERRACLMANHGLVAVGGTLEEAVHLAEALEVLCEQYLRACQLGMPVLLSDEEMQEALAAFRDYGQKFGKTEQNK